ISSDRHAAGTATSQATLCEIIRKFAKTHAAHHVLHHRCDGEPMMHQRCVFAVLFVVGSWLLPIGALAQTATYHLHKEGSKTGGVQQLKTAAPDSAVSTISSADMRSQ